MKQTAYLKLTVFVVLVLAVSCAWAQMPQPFSADFASTTHNGQKMTGKWYFSPPKMRMDMTSMPTQEKSPFGNVSMIIDGTTQTSYMLMPQMQMYMEFKGQSGRENPGMRNLENLGKGYCPEGATCNKVGSEVVNGRSCDKYEITDKNGVKSTAWVDQRLHFPVKGVQADGTQTEFTNIKEGAQDASLFKVPPGYKPFDPSAFGGQRRPK